MMALLLYLWLGPRAALAEVLVEVLIGLTVTCGGGGRRIMRMLRFLLELTRLRPLPTA